MIQSESKGSAVASPPKRVVILGGGVGAMAAAYELTNQPDWYERYEITLYQLGWRLGGKGASGHNREKYERIEEHGLHIWWGFYDNSFEMMKRCYAELNLPNLSFDDAFKPHDLVTFMDQLRGQWFKHEINFPRNPLSPGNIDTPAGLWQCLQRAVGWLWSEFGNHKSLMQTTAESTRTVAPAAGGEMVDADGELALQTAHEKMTGAASSAASDASSAAPWLTDGPELVRLLDSFRRKLTIPTWLLSIVDKLRWFYILADFGITVLIGLISDGVLTNPQGLNSLEGEEFSAWLIRHGVNQEVTLPSPLVRGLYDAAFCFVGGDPQKPNIGTGSILRATLRMVFTYKGAFMWKMQGGMGDVIFAPLYLMLKQRGEKADAARGRAGSLRIEFFHRVENLGLQPASGSSSASAAEPLIETITINQQATIKGGGSYSGVYTDARTGLPVWPSEPLYDQLEQGEAIKRGPAPYTAPYNLESHWTSWPGVGQLTLRRGVDFDHVVMGISLGAIPYLCQELINDPRQNGSWANMVKNVQTTRTQALQMWFGATAATLGWVATEPAVMDAYIDPLNSWADMSQVLPHESWPPQNPPQTVAYFCGPMLDDPNEPAPPNDQYPQTQTALVEAGALPFWAQYYGPLFPNASIPGTTQFDWNQLWAPDGLQGEQRFAWQYVRANIDPSERYVLSVANSFQYRLQPDKSGYANLFLTGDWTNNGLNFGCVESATLGGLIGAKGLLTQLAKTEPTGGGGETTTPGVNISQTPYIEYGGLQVLAPPYALTGISLQLYPVLGNHSAMQSVVDRYLNAVSTDLKFKALGDVVLLQLGYIAQNASINLPDSNYGYGPETSATFIIPVIAYNPNNRIEFSIGLFMPYILVDNSLSLCSGREVFGIPKEIGWFSYDMAQPGSPSTVETLVFPTFSPQTPLQRRVLCTTQRSAVDSGPPSEDWTGSPMPVDSMLSRLYSPRIDGSVPISGPESDKLREHLLSGSMPIYSLRQLRNPQNPTQASFSEITKAVMAVSSISAGGLISGAHDVTINAYDSHPIAKDLLGSESSVTTVRAIFPFWLRFDAQLGNGS